ncbi:MAG: dihydroorotase, partial [Lachnospiraceae bacterium]|nr:dihydroorotase [Candidatus Equihabitans merdae]
PEILRKGLTAAAALDMPVSLHEEDPSYISQNGINHGQASEFFGIQGSPHEAEDSMVARDVKIAAETGCKMVIQHISSGISVDLVRQAKAEGAPVYAEATPHHFTLTDEAVLKYKTFAKMNPPLRTEWDRMEIIRGLKDGTIDVISTDHAPHSKEEKAKPLTEAPSGIIGLETSLALGITSLVKPGHLTMMELLEKMTANPAALYKLPTPEIVEGAPADLIIIDPNEEWVVGDYKSKGTNTPFTGWTLTGRVRTTICCVKVVYSAE